MTPETAAEIAAEVQRARIKFPEARFLSSALYEEVGEYARAQLHSSVAGKDHVSSTRAVHDEAVQVAAMAVRILEEGDATSYSAQGAAHMSAQALEAVARLTMAVG